MQTSVLAFCPAYGETLLAKTTTSLLALALDFPRHNIGFSFSTYSYFDLVRLRNLALSVWYYNTSATHLLCVDADMSFEPSAVRRMIDYDVPLVGVIYPTRSVSTAVKRVPFVGSFLPDEQPNEAGFMKVRGVGGGLMLIRRDCIDRLIEDQPDIVDTRSDKHVVHGDLMRELHLDKVLSAFSYLTVTDGEISREFGEDLSFCERVRQAGMDVWGSVMDPVGHVGLHEWYGCLGKLTDGHGRAKEEPTIENPVWSVSAVPKPEHQAA